MSADRLPTALRLACTSGPRVLLLDPEPDDPLRDALVRLHSTCMAMDCEFDGERPTEAEYQDAMRQAEAALKAAP